MSAAPAPLRGLRRRVAGIAVLNRFAIALRALRATLIAAGSRRASCLPGVRIRERHPPSVAIGRVRRCDRFATPSKLALSIAPRDSYNTPRKPRDGSGIVPPAALRTPPLRRRSANPLKYQWLSLPVAWTTRKHIDDAGGRDYLTPDAARCLELYIPVFIAVSSVFTDTCRHEYAGTSECSLNARLPLVRIAHWRAFFTQGPRIGTI